MTLTVQARARRGNLELSFDFRAAAGITAVVGPSGSGKTSLLDAISGELPLTHGSICLGERKLESVETGLRLPARERRTARAYQDGRLFPHLSVQQNLRFGQSADAISFDEVVETLRLSDLLARRPDQLSGGERQRVALGRALLANGDALLLDEPLQALDDTLRRRLLTALAAWNRRQQRPWLYVTHALEEALLIADAAIAVQQGQVQASGSPLQVLARGFDDPLAHSGAHDMLLRLRVRGHDAAQGISHVECGPVQMETSRLALATGEEFVAAISARDIVLAPERPPALSARNVLPATIASMRSEGDSWHVELILARDIPKLWTTVTTAAVQELHLAEGRSVWVLFKSSALRRML